MHTNTFASSRRRGARVGLAVAGAIAAAGIAAAPGIASASAPADPTAYCQAHLGLEAAMNGGDPAMIGPAVEAATAVVPAELADALATAIATAPTEPGPPNPEFLTAYGQLVEWVSANCGFASIDVLAKDYSFGGLPAEIAAGPTIVNLTNEGTEMHEIVILRRLEGTTEPVEELLALGEEEVFTKVALVGVAMAAPGESAALMADLTPGGYIALCFLPVGATPEMMAEMMAAPEGTGAPMGTGDMAEMAGTEPAGTEPSPHFMEGMIQEFTVVDGAAAPATTGA